MTEKFKLSDEDRKLYEVLRKNRMRLPIWKSERNPSDMIVLVKDSYKKFGREKLEKLINLRIQIDKKLVKDVSGDKIELLWIWESELKNKKELEGKIRDFDEYCNPRYIG